MILSERMDLLRSRRNKETIREKEAFILFLEKSSKDLQRRDYDVIEAKTVRSGLSETEEAETFAWDLGNLDIAFFGGRELLLKLLDVTLTIPLS